ncbi:MAG: agmatine deiminase family protein [Bacteroidetes bacterium]|nr:agmatine deiminase family protein [Bacteroidota bacterium]
MMNKFLRLPAEWEPHKSTIICWPHQKEDWPGKFSPIPWVYAEIVKNLVPGERVRIIIQSQEQKKKVQKMLQKNYVDLAYVDFIVAQTDRGWMRDSSPAFVKSGEETIGISFRFNGWAKYNNWKKDKNIQRVLSRKLKHEMFEAVHNGRKVVLEGGAIDVNGRGTLLTTEECLLDENVQTRNPGFTKNDYEKIFRKYFGVTNVIWLGKGIVGDDTHGHVDDLCRFVNSNTVVLCKEINSSEENYLLLEDNFARLKNAQLEDGSKINVVELPMPSPLYFDNMRVPASYANFYISNRKVLVPTFNDPNDRIALNILAELFTDRIVMGINAVDLVWGLGTLHCLTHEEPE